MDKVLPGGRPETMRNRGKMAMEEAWDGFESPCRRHPSKKQGAGICPLCLKERLNELFCPDCGDQRLSIGSCSCSAFSGASTSSCSADGTKKNIDNNGNGGGSVAVGSVGRISFLIDSDRRPEFEPSKAEADAAAAAAIIRLRRSKSAACSITRTTTAARLDPQTPRTPGKKSFTVWWFLLFKKRRKAAKNDNAKNDAKKDSKDGRNALEKENLKEAARSSCSVSSNSDRIVMERLVKSRSVGVGRSGCSPGRHGYIWDNYQNNKSANVNANCTPSRVNELRKVAGSNPSCAEDSQQQRQSGKGWRWALGSPIRAFKHHSQNSSSSRKAARNKADASPSSVITAAEMCRG